MPDNTGYTLVKKASLSERMEVLLEDILEFERTSKNSDRYQLKPRELALVSKFAEGQKDAVIYQGEDEMDDKGKAHQGQQHQTFKFKGRRLICIGQRVFTVPSGGF